jgi:hypothetical protein
MGIQIKEMVVQGKIGEGGTKSKGKEKEANVKKKDTEKTVGKISYSLRRQIVEECVDEVIDRIQKRLDF